MEHFFVSARARLTRSQAKTDEIAGMVAGTRYRQSAVKDTASGRIFVAPGATDPDTFQQTPDPEGRPSPFFRYVGKNVERMRAMVERARDRAGARRSTRPRKTR